MTTRYGDENAGLPETPAYGVADAGRLERSYRRLLAAYSRRWRARHADEIVGVLMDAAEGAGRRSPTVGEAVDLLGNGLRQRTSSALAWLPAAVRDRVTQLALASGAGLAFVCFIVGEWAPWRSSNQWDYGVVGSVGPFATLGPVVYAVWGAAFAAHLLGAQRSARLLAAVSAAAAMTLPLLAARLGLDRPRLVPLVVLAVLGLLATTGELPPAPAHRAATALCALCFAGLLIVPEWVGEAGSHRLGFYNYKGDGLLSVNAALAVAGPVGIAAIFARRWLLPAAIVAMPVLLLDMPLPGYGGWFGSRSDVVVAAACVLAAAAVAGALVRLGIAIGRRESPARTAHSHDPAPARTIDSH